MHIIYLLAVYYYLSSTYSAKFLILNLATTLLTIDKQQIRSLRQKL